MNQDKTSKTNKVLPMSKATRKRIHIVANSLKDKDLFPEKVALAKKTLGKLKSLPI